MTPILPFWERFGGSGRFLERGFIEQSWSFETARAQFKERYGAVASLQSLKDWWTARIEAMGRGEFLRRVAESASRTSAAVEAKLRAGGEPDLQAMAALFGEMVLNLGTALRLNMASGGFKPSSKEIQKSLDLVTALADKALKAGAAADRRQEHKLKVQELQQKLAAAAPADRKRRAGDPEDLDRVISQETLEKVERELKLL